MKSLMTSRYNIMYLDDEYYPSTQLCIIPVVVLQQSCWVTQSWSVIDSVITIYQRQCIVEYFMYNLVEYEDIACLVEFSIKT